MSEENNITTIKLSKGTRDKLIEIGKKGETYDDLILKLISAYNFFNKAKQ